MAAAEPLEVEELRAAIERFRRPCAEEGESFIAEQDLRDYFTPIRTLDRLLKALEISDQHQQAIQNRCLRVFVILVLIKRDQEISKFTRDLRLNDQTLPFHSDDISRWPEDCQSFFQDFYDCQWQFCVKKWTAGVLTDVDLPDKASLPVRTQESIRMGTNSQTWKVELYPDHNELTINTDTFLLKSCVLNDLRVYQNELSTYRKLMTIQDVQPSIVTLHGDFKHRQKLHLVLEFIDGSTLNTLYSADPLSPAEIPSFWASLLGVYTVISCLHNLRILGTEYKAIHQDIKPSNILVRPTPSGWTIKLIDFAFAHFHKRDRSGRTMILDESGTQMYSAPDQHRIDTNMRNMRIPVEPTVDNWSFGAVLSETFVWSLMGQSGLEKYRRRRCDQTKGLSALAQGGYEGCFHDGENVLAVVEDTHDEALGSSVFQNDNSGLRDLLFLIKSLAERMLVNEINAQMTDAQIYKECQKIIEKARRLHATNVASIVISSNQSGTPISNPVPVPSPSQKMQPPELPPPDDHSDQSFHQIMLTNINQTVSPGSQVQDPQTMNGGTGMPRVSVKDVREWIVKKKAESHILSKGSPPPLQGRSLLKDLQGKEQVFLFAESPTMGKYWVGPDSVLETFEALGYLVKDQALHGTRAVLPSTYSNWSEKNRAGIIARLRMSACDRECNMYYWLNKLVFENWEERKNAFKKNKRIGRIVYIFTDGLWEMAPGNSKYCDVDQILNQLSVKLYQDAVSPARISVRFIRFGHDHEGSERIDSLIEKWRKDNKREFWNVVDCEPQGGNVWKMLFGPYHRPGG